MNVSKLTAAVLAVLVVSTGVGAVAATPGNGNAPDDAGTNAANAPTEEADANATDARDEGMSRDEVEERAANESDAANDSESMADPANASEGQTPRSEEAADAASEERRGPPADLPEQVPDHVSEIHQRIVSFLDGELENLGAAVSDVTPTDDSEDAETDGDAQAAENADDEADAAATSTEEPETEEPTTEEPETEEPETEDGDSTETATATATTEA